MAIHNINLPLFTPLERDILRNLPRPYSVCEIKQAGLLGTEHPSWVVSVMTGDDKFYDKSFTDRNIGLINKMVRHNPPLYNPEITYACVMSRYDHPTDTWVMYTDLREAITRILTKHRMRI